MPMRSQAQRAYLHIHHPKIAARFEKEAPADEPLPERVGMADGGEVEGPDELAECPKCGHRFLAHSEPDGDEDLHPLTEEADEIEGMSPQAQQQMMLRRRAMVDRAYRDAVRSKTAGELRNSVESTNKAHQEMLVRRGRGFLEDGGAR